MSSEGLLGKILDWLRTASPAAIFGLLVINLTALFKYWGPIMARRNERLRDIELSKTGDWERLRAEITRLDGRCDHLQGEVDECREREGKWMERAIAAEATLLGRGEARQEITILESSKRLEGDKDA